MNHRSIPACLAMFFCLAGVFAQDDDGSFSNDEFLQIFNCVGKYFDRCNQLWIYPANHVLEACLTAILGADDKAECSNDKELYGSEDNRRKINECFIQNIPEDLNDEQQQNKKDFDDCVKEVGEDCSEEESR
ncbi:hypothetical protein NPIL_585971 [Nephila pilipes]|uniref:Spider venom protein n=1 Tax=Nephila pilipes TaxID=299642 RepID=A0A8X6R2D8_NEPPI|nr:hypothetical protein NPIL_585971 [Nephila pilipes]